MIQIAYSIIISFCIPFSLVGDIDNSPARNNHGAVNYEYEISTFEITNSQYCVFLNSVATKDNDKYQFYSPIMGQNFMGGVVKVVDGENVKFVVKPGYENKPIIGVSWKNAIYFINWLNYNCDLIEIGADQSSLRPYFLGNRKGSSYDLRDGNIVRRDDSRYWMPNIDEWQKACYYNGKNWDYKYLSDGANIYSIEKGWAYGFPHIKDVGFGVSPTYYGTYDQQGNVAEWIENGNGEFKYALGGSLIRPFKYAIFGEYEGDFPDKSIATFGLRICRTANKKLRAIAPDFTLKKDTLFIKNNQKAIIRDKNGGVYVTVEFPGNEGDVVNQYKGRVNYKYNISKYELTNQEYCNFLNSVAQKNDYYRLWDSNMEFSVCGGINRVIRSDGSFLYVVKPNYEKKPVSYIGFYELARYANWLHFGCPYGSEVLGVTEGTNEIGAYDTSDFELVRFGKKKVSKEFGQRNKGAKYWIPNEDEWYKAAYFDPTIIGNRKYHDYPTRSSDIPALTMANFMRDSQYSIGQPYFVADVDAFSQYASFFGTVQQGGNVWEWTESWQYDIPGCRSLRGGSWQYTEYGMNAINEDPGGINDKSYLFGGRLCKSYDNDGYENIENSFADDIYLKIHLMSKKQLLLIVSLLSALCFGVLILSCYLIVKRYHK